jgi:hypothetical protein
MTRRSGRRPAWWRKKRGYQESNGPGATNRPGAAPSPGWDRSSTSTCDHVEILYDIDIRAQEVARAQGIRLERPPALNTDPLFISALVKLIEKKITALVGKVETGEHAPATYNQQPATAHQRPATNHQPPAPNPQLPDTKEMK